MKKLLILPLLVLLTSCVTYYYPETALEDGVYYAEDDPSYNVYQGYYPGYTYYPWSTLDYFYMGYYPYPHYAYYYGYGYSPWHYPFGYYGYYPPLYRRHYYPRYATWYPYSGYCMGYDRCSRGHRDHDEDSGDRLVGNRKNNRRNRADVGIDDNNMTVDEFENPNATFTTGAVPYRRYVSTMPSGYGGSQGMVIRSGSSAKVGKSRIQPGSSSSTSNGIIIVAEPSQSVVTPVSKSGGSASMPTTSPGRTTPRSASPPASRSFSSSRSSGSVKAPSPTRSSRSSSSSRSMRSSSTRTHRKRD